MLKMSQCQIMSNVVKMSKCQMSRLTVYKQKVTKDLNNGKKIFPNFRPCSSSPRERNVLNIMAFLNRPIEGSDLVIDLTQSIGWCQNRTDGIMPTLATKDVDFQDGARGQHGKSHGLNGSARVHVL